MRAAFYEKNGPAREVLRVADIETPEPAPGEVRVKLSTTGVNPSDVKAREGRTRKIAWPRVVPHSDGAGVIDMVGDGVPQTRVGERVWIWNAQWKRAFGTCAEYVVLPAALAVPLPDAIEFAAGACLGIPAMTAYHAIATADAWAGSTLLVSGGAGGVGHYAIQYARKKGAHVIATARAENHDFVKSQGAHDAVDYTAVDFATAVKDCDLVLDTLGGDAHFRAMQCLKPGGTLVWLNAAPLPQTQPRGDIQVVHAMVRAARPQMERVGQLAAEGVLKPHVSATFPLERAAEAYAMVQTGRTRGKVVLTVR
jgi:NADPH2:quinone reductase